METPAAEAVLHGRQLDEVFLLSPSAVPATGGAAPASPTAVPPTGGLFGGGPPPTGAPVSNPTSTPIGGAPTTGFSDGREGVAAYLAGVRLRRARILSNPPTSPLNLIGKLEGWGIGPATPVSEVTIKVSSATGAQLRELLKKLPDGMTLSCPSRKRTADGDGRNDT